MPDAPVTAATVDITNCDREPIHIPGTIQPFGFLVTLSTDWMITRVSDNIERFMGIAPDRLIGKPIGTLLSDEAIHTIRNRLTVLRGGDMVERLFAIALQEEGPLFDVAVHFSGNLVVVEAEPAIVDEEDISSTVRAMIGRLSQATDQRSLFREGARQVRAITGFDRVMVYRFDSAGSGEVVAESVKPGVDSFLGLNYPATDIPAQARALYIRNIFRVIADVNAPPATVSPTLDARGEPLDMSLALLRAVSPIHIEYLRNMGVGASLSISIVIEGKLWGLFACHHYAPKLPSLSKRTVAELFGQMFSLMLESRQRHELGDFEQKAREVGDRLMAALAADNDLIGNAAWIGDVISEAIPADGVGVYVDGRIALSGLAPDRDAFERIVRALNTAAASSVYATDHIAGLVPTAGGHADRAAGMLSIPLSRSPRDYVVLFRAERLRSVRWAGNPEKPIEYGPNGPRLSPRKSFEEWSELVRGRALPFTPAEIRVADTLRTTLLEVVLRMSESAGEERQRASERQELLIAELNHRVRNILALIRGLISQTKGSAQSAEAFVETLDDRIRALARAHDQITADRWAPASLIDLIETEVAAYLSGERRRVTLTGPNVLLDPVAFTTLALIIHELTTNAAKYGALSDSGTVAIDWHVDAEGDLRLVWTESGGPAVQPPKRRGFGSTIIERSLAFDLAGKAEVHYRLSGLEACFCLPARFVTRVKGNAAPAVTIKAPPAAPERLLEGKRLLLVEDSMIIALDGEDALRALGAADVVTASTISEGLSAIEAGGLDAALLDFNLGTETSLPIADALAASGVPFLFATGYGDQLDLPGLHRQVDIVKKPYGRDTLAVALANLLGTGDSGA